MGNAMLLAGVVAGFVGLTEVGLRAFSPVQLTTIGTDTAENARLYGWGFGPGERILVSDPDTNQIHVDIANQSGWRDKNREVAKPPGTLRILALGDSNTFGAIVPGARVYTRLLEERLRAEGYSAEILNMAYGGWSTDQELEAFRNEGRRYQPDIVLVQFTSNDPGENLGREGATQGKPFRYVLDGPESLVREAVIVPGLTPDKPAAWRRRIKRFVRSSEVLKRTYLAYSVLRYQAPHAGGEGYRVTHRRLMLVTYRLGLDKDDPLYRFLEGHLDQTVNRHQIETALQASPNRGRLNDIMEMMAPYWFHDYWTVENYYYPPPDPDSPAWRLTLALLRTIGKEAKAMGAQTWIMSDQEEGAYTWLRRWSHISPDPASREAFMAANDILRRFAMKNDMEFVETLRPVTRARLDPHPNQDGNQAMADNVYHHLMNHHADLMAGFRTPRP
jgi:lysophospholipase L1-like esterase